MSRPAALLFVSLSLVAACQGGAPPPVTSPEGDAKTPTSGPTSDTTKETPAGGRVAANSPNAGKDERAGTVRPFAGDDPGKAVAIPGKRGWTLGPGDSWAIGLYEFVRADGTKNVFKAPGGEPDFSIPGAYTFPATP